MSQSFTTSTPTVVSQKGDRTTGSPLLDSFVLDPPKGNTVYLSEGLVQNLTTSMIEPQRDRLASSFINPVASQLTASSATASPHSVRKNSVTVLNQPRKSLLTQQKEKNTGNKPSTSVEASHLSKEKWRAAKQPDSSTSSPPSSATHSHAESHAESHSDAAVSSALQAAEPQPFPEAASTEVSSTETALPAAPLPAASIAEKTKPTVLDSPSQAAPIQAAVQRRKRPPNPSLEKAAAVGMLDLSDKLLFGGEDDELINTYLGGVDPLTTEDDETIVFKYLSKQIAESRLTKMKSHLPISPHASSSAEQSKAVLDAKNFRVAQTNSQNFSNSNADNSNADNNSNSSDASQSKLNGQDSQSKAASQNHLSRQEHSAAMHPSAVDVKAINQQIDWLNQRVAYLTEEISDLTRLVPRKP